MIGYRFLSSSYANWILWTSLQKNSNIELQFALPFEE